MSKNEKWSSAAKFEIALQALKNETKLNEICKKMMFHQAKCMHGKNSF